MPRSIRFIIDQHRIHRRVGLGSYKSARRAVLIWVRGF